jgi:hypothetical protein
MIVLYNFIIVSHFMVLSRENPLIKKQGSMNIKQKTDAYILFIEPNKFLLLRLHSIYQPHILNHHQGW